MWERQYDFRKFQQAFYLSVQRRRPGRGRDVGRLSRPRLRRQHRDPDVATQPQAWRRDHHGGGLQHPVIIDGCRLRRLQGAGPPNKGKVLRDDLPERRGCGTMSGSGTSIFFRHYDHTMWDLEDQCADHSAGHPKRVLAQPDPGRRPAAGAGEQLGLLLHQPAPDLGRVPAEVGEVARCAGSDSSRAVMVGSLVVAAVS